MGRPVKLSDQDKRWYRPSRRRSERQVGIRDQLQSFLIICEGRKTEKHYFEGIRSELRSRLINVKVIGKGENTLRLVNAAIKERDQAKSRFDPIDRVWVVFDLDEFPKCNFDNAISKAEANQIRCAWSNEAFELWYHLHFKHSTTEIQRADFDELLSGFLGERYHKADPDIYSKLLQHGSQDEAIKRAKQLHKRHIEAGLPPSRSNPCTTVFLLVEALNQFKKDRKMRA